MLVSFQSYKGGTGKTNIVGNLATLIAKQNQKVCIIDTDLNGPGIHSLFNIEFENSLIEFMKNNCNIKDIIYKPKPEYELYLIPTRIWEDDLTSFFPSPSDAKEKFRELISYLQNECNIEHILFDCGPGINRSSLLIMNLVERSIIISTIDRQDIRGTYIIANIAKKINANSKLIFNKIPPDQYDNMADIIKDFSNKLNIELINIIKYDESVANTWSRRLVVDTNLESGFSEQIRDIYNKIFFD